MACTDQKMSKQLTAGARKHRTLTVPQKLEIVSRTEYGKIQTEVIASYNTDQKISMIQRNGRTNYDHLLHQVEV
jgi:hypothetical protein